MSGNHPAFPPLRRPSDIVFGAEAPELTPTTDSSPEPRPAQRKRAPKPKPDRVEDPGEQLTVYMPVSLVLELERFRLELRRKGVKADRGRIIRAAVIEALAHAERLERGIMRGDGA